MSTSVSDMINRIDAVFESSQSSAATDILQDISLSQISSDDDISLEITNSTNVSSLLSNSDDEYSNFITQNQEESTSFQILPSDGAEIKSFLSLFNAKYGCDAKDLDKVIPNIDRLLKKKEKLYSPKKLAESSKNLPSVQTLIDHITELETENKKLKEKLELSEEECEKYKKQVSDFENKSANAEKQNISLQNDLQNLQNALAQMYEITESQLNDISILGQQRSQLVEITSKQTKLIQKLETLKAPKLVLSPQKPQNNEKRHISPEKEREDEAYTILSSLVKVIDESLPYSITKRIQEIKNNSSLTLHERILLITKNMTETINTMKGNENTELQKSNKLAENCELYRNKCFELIEQFRELLNFMQTFSRSAELQSTMSGKPLNDETKHEIVRKLCVLVKYVDETIGAISEEKMNEIGQVQNETHIYDLLTPNRIEEKVSTITNLIADDNIDALEVSNLLSAQMFINEILKMHINELRERISIAQREVAIARKPVDTYEDIIPINKQLMKQQLKIRNFLYRIVPETDKEEPVYELLKRAVKILVDENEKLKKEEEKRSSSIVQKEDISIQSQDNELFNGSSIGRNYQKEAKKCAKMNEQLTKQLEKIATKVNQEKEKRKVLVEKNKDLASKIVEMENEKILYIARIKKLEAEENERLQAIESARSIAETSMNQHSELKNKIDEMKDAHMKELNEYKVKLENSNNKLAAMTKKIEENAQIVLKIKKQRHALGKQIEKLQAANRMLQETVDCQSVRVKRECMDSLGEIQIQLATAKREISRQAAAHEEMKEKIKQQQTELATITAAKKIVEFKLKATEEKMELERKNYQSQLSAQTSAVKSSQQTKTDELQKRINDAESRLSALVPTVSLPSSLEEALSMAETGFNNLRKSQVEYISILDSLKGAQEILGVDSPHEIVSAVQAIVEKIKENENISKQAYESHDSKTEIATLKRLVKSGETSAAQLKQWEMWGRRLDAMLHEGEIVRSVDSAGIRLSLEEKILASVSHRKIFERVESLRSQKRLLLCFDKRLLGPINEKISLRSLMIVGVALRKISKLAGVQKVLE